MSSIKKLVLLPVNKYERLVKNQSLSQQTEGQTTNNEPSSVQVKTSAVLENIEDESKSSQLDVDLILAAIPRLFKARAKGLLDHIGQSANIDWNGAGELVLRGRPIPNTHIADLVKHAMRNYTQFNPRGQHEFYTSLAEINVPRALIGNTRGLHQLQEGRNIITPPGILDHTPTVSRSWISLE